MIDGFLIFTFISIILLFSLICIRRMNNIISKLFLGSFVGYWCASLMISLFNPFGLYKVSTYAYLLLLLNVLFFVLGFISVKQKNYSKIGSASMELDMKIASVVNNKYFVLLLLFAACLCVKIYSDYAALFELQGKRTDSMTEVIIVAGSFVTLLYSFFLSPFFYIVLPIFVLSLFFCRKWHIILIMLVYIISYSMIGGRRNTFLTIIMAFFFVYMLRNMISRRNIVFPKYVYLIMFVTVVLMYVMMCFVTATMIGRYQEWNLEAFLYGMDAINETFVAYSTLPFRLFDYAIHNHYYEMIGETYGLATFSSLYKYLSELISVFGVNMPPLGEKITTYLQDTVILTGVDRVSNYSYTNALFFYLDFKLPGIIIFSFLFGFFIHYIIQKVIKHLSISSVCLLFYLYFVVLHTVFTWHFLKVYSWLLVIMLMYMAFIRRERLAK